MDRRPHIKLALCSFLLSCCVVIFRQAIAVPLAACSGGRATNQGTHVVFYWAAIVARDEGFFDDILPQLRDSDRFFNVSLQHIEEACKDSRVVAKELGLLYGYGNNIEGYIQSKVRHIDPMKGLLGCGCSASTELLADLLASWEIPMLGPSASAPAISVTKHPNFFRFNTPRQNSAQGYAALINLFAWSRVVGISSSDNIGLSWQHHLFEELSSSVTVILQIGNAEILSISGKLPHTSDLLEVKAKKAALLDLARAAAYMKPQPRIFMVLYMEEFDWVLRAYDKFGLASNQTVWLVAVKDLKRSIPGNATLLSSPSNGAGSERTRTLAWNSFLSNLNSAKLVSVGCPEDLANDVDWIAVKGSDKPGWFEKCLNAFDAATMMIVGISDLLGSGKGLEEIDGASLIESIKHQRFQGVSSHLAFDELQSLQRNLTITYTLLEDGTWQSHIVGFLNIQVRSDGTFKKTLELTHDLQFANGLLYQDSTSEVPPDRAALCPQGTEFKVTHMDGGGAEQMNVCVSCPPGWYNRHADHNCETCDSGSFTNDSGMTACFDAPAGTFVKETGQSSYEHCAIGYSSSIKGASTCIACGPGLYADHVGSLDCNSCPSKTYQPLRAQDHCEPCPATFTSLPGSRQLSECKCPHGSHFNGLVCTSCMNFVGVDCPGGYQFGCNVTDSTPQIIEGWMALPEAPFDTYKCVDDSRCPGKRSPFTAGMCPPNFKLFPQCARCMDKYTAKGSACVKCGDGDSLVAIVFKTLAFLCGQFFFMLYLFTQMEKATTAIGITIGSTLTFIQVVQSLAKLPLAWPSVIQGAFGFVGFAEPPTRHVRFDCVGGHSFLSGFTIDVVTPLQVFVYIGGICLLRMCLRQPVHKDRLLNMMGTVFSIAFITISRDAMNLFAGEQMPQGQVMLKGFPGIRRGSDEWRQCLPLGILAVLIYCCSFLAWVVYGVLVAPVQTSANPYFLVRFKFAFASLRPDRWWFALVKVGYSFSVVFAQVISPDIEFQVYATCIVFFVVAALEFVILPYKFVANIVINLSFQCSLLLFLTLSTAFFDYNKIDPVDHEHTVEQLGAAAVVLLIFALLNVLVHVFVTLRGKVQKTENSIAPMVAVAMRFRDATLGLGLVSDRDFLRSVSLLSEIDVHQLDKATQMMVGAFLGLQPSSKLSRQRLIPGRKYSLWNPQDTLLDYAEAFNTATLQNTLARNLSDRLGFMELAEDIRANNLLQKLVFPQDGMTEESFCRQLMPLTNTREACLRDMFEFMDIDGSGKLSRDEFKNIVVGMCPPLHAEREERFRHLLQESGTRGTTSMNQATTCEAEEAPVGLVGTRVHGNDDLCKSASNDSMFDEGDRVDDNGKRRQIPNRVPTWATGDSDKLAEMRDPVLLAMQAERDALLAERKAEKEKFMAERQLLMAQISSLRSAKGIYAKKNSGRARARACAEETQVAPARSQLAAAPSQWTPSLAALRATNHALDARAEAIEHNQQIDFAREGETGNHGNLAAVLDSYTNYWYNRY